MNDPDLPALGYSWLNRVGGQYDQPRDPRVHVCVYCVDRNDQPDVKIIQVPLHEWARPKCYRCAKVLPFMVRGQRGR
jgi:hypothetical protein